MSPYMIDKLFAFRSPFFQNMPQPGMS
uniref:Uncharacterized protein n=1 Tax=Triticum urartu TaxID=4572 RepID=A0A8R7PDZ5_TRIUA